MYSGTLFKRTFLKRQKRFNKLLLCWCSISNVPIVANAAYQTDSILLETFVFED